MALRFRVTDVANFTTHLYTEGCSGSAVSSTITALDMTRAVLNPDSHPLANDQIIRTIRKASFARRPPPRALLPTTYYDPICLFKYLGELVHTTNIRPVSVYESRQLFYSYLMEH